MTMMSARKAARLEALGWNIDYEVAARPHPMPAHLYFPVSRELGYLLVPVRDHDTIQETIEAVVKGRK